MRGKRLPPVPEMAGELPTAVWKTVTVFFTTDLPRIGAAVVQATVLRWPIEVSFPDVTQYLGGEDPQSWVDLAPDRNVA